VLTEPGGVTEAGQRAGDEQPVQQRGPGLRPLPEQRCQQGDDQQGADVDLHLHRHRPDVLVQTDVPVDRRVLLALTGQVEVLYVEQGRRRVRARVHPADLGVDHHRQDEGHPDDRDQRRVEAPEDTQERLQDGEPRRVQCVTELRGEEEDSTDEQEDVHAG
jgi:hypothetical protein